MSEPKCVTALKNYLPADLDGVMVAASRQAIHETIDLLENVSEQRDVLLEVGKWLLDRIESDIESPGHTTPEGDAARRAIAAAKDSH